ncbi:hypothetical protein I4U23_027416 [Adineta vaga]|nr:hypothetical protein I4U23_027416 [Adineta vaga]
MRSLFILAICVGVLVSCIHAVGNCRCQDNRGQYTEITRICCLEQQVTRDVGVVFMGPNNQCMNPMNRLDSGAFERCCKTLAVGGASCW